MPQRVRQAAFNELGYAVVPSLCDYSELVALRQAIDEALASIDRKQRRECMVIADASGQVMFASGLESHARSPTSRAARRSASRMLPKRSLTGGSIAGEAQRRLPPPSAHRDQADRCERDDQQDHRPVGKRGYGR